MELQGLQEALKVEIQCHQDGELKRQLHDRQTRITALSDKQVSSNMFRLSGCHHCFSASFCLKLFSLTSTPCWMCV
uniref:Uncharacterized protein n=1 Tax=Seriola lalandi dorsalis TaxID=1841481 RepID=A0A3B4YPX5_SERLL